MKKNKRHRLRFVPYRPDYRVDKPWKDSAYFRHGLKMLAPTVLVILVILALIVFSALSLSACASTKKSVVKSEDFMQLSSIKSAAQASSSTVTLLTNVPLQLIPADFLAAAVASSSHKAVRPHTTASPADTSSSPLSFIQVSTVGSSTDTATVHGFSVSKSTSIDKLSSPLSLFSFIILPFALTFALLLVLFIVVRRYR